MLTFLVLPLARYLLQVTSCTTKAVCTTKPIMNVVPPAGSLPTQQPITPAWRPEGCDVIALTLQGGGALGAYQAGIYQALHEAGVEPDSIAGVSIGAINGAIIAGNPREHRLQRLRDFWEGVTAQRIWPFAPDGDEIR